VGGYGARCRTWDVGWTRSSTEVCDYGDSDVLPGNTDGHLRGHPGVHRHIVGTGPSRLIMGGPRHHPATATAVADHYATTVGIVHFDAHADTAPDMRATWPGRHPDARLIESGAVPGRNFVQVGLRGYWPPRDVADWMETNELRTTSWPRSAGTGSTPCSSGPWTRRWTGRPPVPVGGRGRLRPGVRTRHRHPDRVG